MEAKLKELIEMGEPMDKGDSMKEEMKEYYLGGKAIWLFPCPVCENSFTTKKEYRTSDDYIRDSISIEVTYKLSEMFRRVLGSIPIIGQFLYHRADRKLDAKEDSIEEKKYFATQIKAFEEVKDQFKKCTKCGSYSCVSCYKDGLCGKCGYVSDTGNELNQEFEKQIADQEKMYAELIEKNPENKEMLMQQMEEARKQIREAQKGAMDNYNKSD